MDQLPVETTKLCTDDIW